MDTSFNLLNQYRLRRGMTMTAFAKEIGLSNAVVRRALLGLTDPHDYHKYVFDEYYRKHHDEIIQHKEEKETTGAALDTIPGCR